MNPLFHLYKMVKISATADSEVPQGLTGRFIANRVETGIRGQHHDFLFTMYAAADAPAAPFGTARAIHTCSVSLNQVARCPESIAMFLPLMPCGATISSERLLAQRMQMRVLSLLFGTF